jgi:hypothetical protein
MSSLTCFPTPLPDESLYSIFCRYHVRSCNNRDSTTISQLFDQGRSLQTSILSPRSLKYARDWIDTTPGFNRSSLMLDHTAYPFYRTFIQNPNPKFSSYAADRFFLSLYTNCCTPSKRLRYCPKCAQAQWENFGTAYWQILPQINGYEICPMHLEPIRETVVTHKNIMCHFFPASNVLFNSDTNGSHQYTDRLRRIDAYWDSFLQMSQDILFIFRSSISNFILGAKIRRVLLYDLLPVQKKWDCFLLNDPVLDQCGDSFLTDYFASLYRDHYKLATEISLAPVLYQLRICRMLFGNIKRFVSRRV